ncbi:MAG: hypothetical protein C4B59_12885 [Candidatus Methanogaster sp.]|uniref:Uncharacterized protein n=1 Tax=Candidatus Methanogaster sp. TaxID=3386292 RepID=A0AC61L028_9EURY|nr:MAG: hypothetical protein C4B59_12885 [ANME-2 cluster archaeon]
MLAGVAGAEPAEEHAKKQEWCNQNTTTNTCENGVIKLESISVIHEFVTLTIPMVSLPGLVLYMRRRGQK